MNKFNQLYKNIPTPIVNFKFENEKEPIIISANKSFIDTFTEIEDENKIIGQNLNTLIVPENKTNESKMFDEKSKKGIKNRDYIERKTPKGIKRFAYRSISYDEDEVFAMYTDITDEIQKSEQINVLNRILRHNLRNELNVIMGLNHTIKNQTTNKDINNYCDKISKKISCLTRLTSESKTINDVLSSNNKLKILNLNTQIKYGLKECESDFDTSPININVPLDITVKSGDKLYVVIESLIDNALRYNNSQNPNINIFISKKTNEHIIFSIKDNGPGIEKQEKDIINNKKEISELNHGSGLGLWLSKWIIEKYGGKINIHINDCGGTTIDIKLLRGNLNNIE